MRIAHVTTDFYGKLLSEALRLEFEVDDFQAWGDIKDHHKYDMTIVEYLGAEAINATKRSVSKNLVLRTRGVEVYEGHLRKIIWAHVKWLLTLGEHQVDYFERRWHRLGCKPYNIDWLPQVAPLEKFELRKDPKENNNVAMLSNITGRKGSDRIPEFLLRYPNKRIEHYGTICAYGYSVQEFVRWRLEKLGLSDRYKHRENVSFDKISEWLENKTYLFFPSIAEGLGRAVLECMCKGVKPIIRNYKGASELWPSQLLYNDIKDIDRIMDLQYEPEAYRKFVEDRYSKQAILNKFKDIFGL
ncbi:hypothetical protein LCGC14_1260780 [marine sediment metagenome]|uniref:Glycosyl transferase family 1 domain-containing protein n=1 Tax=marine sediment metagenome TaxID=412755 RepID=A0A0F9L370_9ZZZZ